MRLWAFEDDDLVIVLQLYLVGLVCTDFNIFIFCLVISSFMFDKETPCYGRYVIDSGYVKQRQYNPATGMYSLDIVQISK